MNPADKNLLNLAQHIRRGLPRDDAQGFRDALTINLLPMIRCALRSGVGHPHLVSWVRHQAANNPMAAPDPVRAAPPIARALAERLMERLDPLPGRETVAGP
jgi:hypothetical protein